MGAYYYHDTVTRNDNSGRWKVIEQSDTSCEYCDHKHEDRYCWAKCVNYDHAKTFSRRRANLLARQLEGWLGKELKSQEELLKVVNEMEYYMKKNPDDPDNSKVMEIIKLLTEA